MITKIEFKRTSNIFINAGIVALYQYLKVFKEDANVEYDYSYSLEKDALSIQCDKLFTLLEDVYYYMGRELYDTSGKNARNSADKYFFTEEPFDYKAFFKMKTYGLGALITNDPQPTPKEENNAITFENLVKKNPEFATKVGQVYYQQKLKLKDYEPTVIGYEYSKDTKGDSKIFLNEPYIKITRLEKPKKEFFEAGNQVCYLTNEPFKKLVDSQNTSPFIKGLNNFNSFLSPQSQKISWKVMYISRFSPKLNLYTYVSGLDSIVCYFFDSNNLINLNTLYEQNRSMYKDSVQMIESNYMSNFITHSFFNRDEKFSEPKDYTGKYETLFALIYSFYKQFLYDKGFDDINEVDNIFDLGFDKIPISLISFKADSFSSTLRPNAFEYFSNFKFAIRLIIYLEKEGIKFSQLLSSLKFMKTSERNSGNSYLLERKQREKVLTKILNGKSVVSEIAHLYYQCYTYLLKGDPVGFKNYEQLYLFTSKYELKINIKMTPELQEKAYKLGTSIGMAITRFENPENKNDEKTNAKSGRKYIIDLNKSRTLDQFNDAIIRIMNKYQLQVNSELFKENLNEENFEMVKQFAIIGALNVINNVIKPINTNNNEKQ
jgi:hypothetical protein